MNHEIGFQAFLIDIIEKKSSRGAPKTQLSLCIAYESKDF